MEDITGINNRILEKLWHRNKHIFPTDTLWIMVKKMGDPVANWAMEEILKRQKNK